MLWRRLHGAGSDACRCLDAGHGWLIEGAAAFEEDGVVAALSYHVRTGTDWATRTARITGFAGARAIDIAIHSLPAGGFTVNGAVVAGVAGLPDVDLGFTPATNLNAIRRLDLTVGEETETTAAWLDTQDWQVKPLRQMYRRIAADRFAYASLAHDYEAELETDEFGFVTRYPGLWQAIA